MADPAPLQILVVDDDADTRANLHDILELDAYQVETAGTAAEALARNDWGRLSAIILDRKLPDGSPEELLPRLRQLAPQAAVIIVTGYGDVQGAVSALRLGAADYILKPVDAGELRARLGGIVERRRAEQELQRAQEKLVQAERLAAIGQMMAGLAHESGNALARSQSCLEMLSWEVEDRPEALDLIRRIQQAQDHLKQLYEEVRGYAAPLKLEREPWSLSAVWRQAWDNLTVLRRGRDATLQEETTGVDLVCSVDQFRLGQVFRNILENALAACRDPVRITVRCTDTELEGRPAVQVAVRDNGPGLTPEQRERIFDPFFTTKTRGTGLGMAIARRIVEAHGGQIAVGLDPSATGAEILITLPREGP
jgi:C4-dicarboxylate-specific signal transduction histidine kinase